MKNLHIKAEIVQCYDSTIESKKQFEANMPHGTGKDFKLEKNEILVVASAPDTDRHGESIIQSGWIVESEDGMIPIFVDHDTRVEKAVGRGKPFLHDDLLYEKIRMTDATQTARDTKALIDDGIITTVSVGFKNLESGGDNDEVLLQNVLYETSFVGVEAQPKATVQKKQTKKKHEHEMVESEKYDACEVQILKCECGKESTAFTKTAESKDLLNVNIASEDAKASKTDKKAEKRVDNKGRIKNVKLATRDLQEYLAIQKQGTDDVKKSVTLLQRFLSNKKNKLN